MKKVTFGIVNCNRLFYLTSCFESLFETTSEYENREFIVVDNASVEEGTREYLTSLEDRGVKVIRKQKRDPSNEFAMGLNEIVEKSSGDYVCMLQGDTQFVLSGWLSEMVEFYDMNQDVVGSIFFDAQRRVRNASQKIVQFQETRMPKNCRNTFFADLSRDPLAMAADAIYSRKVLDQIMPWYTRNVNHEGGMDSENEMRYKVRNMISQGKIPQYVMALTAVPQSVAIYTDSRGTQGRVRGNRRYGDYWKAKDTTGWKYYEYIRLEDFDTSKVNSIEDVARPIGYSKVVGPDGNWLKNPIRPETASSNDWVELPEYTP